MNGHMNERMKKSAHLIGICGAGMAATARLLQQQKYQVSGSDDAFYPPVSDYLKKLGLEYCNGYRADNIPAQPDLIVIGKNARLLPTTNEEVHAAFEHHRKKIKSFPEILAQITRDRHNVVVAGSYGKSTLTSLIAWCLHHAGHKPGYFIGAIPKNLEMSSDIGAGEYFILEGDEYPSAHFDDRAKFLHYAPQAVLLTSACHDHVNIYPTLQDYHEPFRQLLALLANTNGQLIACTDETNANGFYQNYTGPKTSYGLSSGEWQATDIHLSSPTRFALLHKGTCAGTLATPLLGRHNIENIIGAAAWVLGQGIMTYEEFAAAIARFDGLARRLTRNNTNTRLVIYEGFGSSYEKARAAIAAIKAHYPNKSLTVLFEPHTFTWRNRSSLPLYKTAFMGADKVWLYRPASQGEASHNQLSLNEILCMASDHHNNVKPFDDTTYRHIVEKSDPDKDVLLILSSGNFDGLLQNIAAQAEEAYPLN